MSLSISLGTFSRVHTVGYPHWAIVWLGRLLQAMAQVVGGTDHLHTVLSLSL